MATNWWIKKGENVEKQEKFAGKAGKNVDNVDKKWITQKIYINI